MLRGVFVLKSSLHMSCMYVVHLIGGVLYSRAVH